MIPNRPNTTAARIVEDAIKVQLSDGTHCAARLMNTHGIPIRVIARVLLEPGRRRGSRGRPM